MAHDEHGGWIGLGLGDRGGNVPLLNHRLLKAFNTNSKASEFGVVDNGDEYTDATRRAVIKLASWLNANEGGSFRTDGIANAAFQKRVGAVVNPSPPQPAYRKIWFYSAPGSGAPWWVGPSFEVGQWCKSVLHINHQPVGFPIGGYMGMLGGDPGLSYNEVIGFEGAELERLIAACPDLNDPNVEFWFSGYSQSADGLEDALVRLFGDGGRFAHLRARINGVIQFGNPSKRTTGIARKVRPEWLYALVHNLNHPTDFYAEADDEIRPLFYAEIVQAETSLPFFVHVMKIALPVVAGLPFIGALIAPVMALAGPLMGLIDGPDEPVDAKLEQLLTVQGVLTNLPALFKLLGALPGIAAHGDFGSLVPPACDIVASFRR